MATYEKIKLSGDSRGGGIELNSFAGTVNVHLTGVSSTVLDEIWLYATNGDQVDTNNLIVTINSTNAIYLDIPPASGLVLVIPGLLAWGNGSTGTLVTARNTTSTNTGIVSVRGFVNRITP